MLSKVKTVSVIFLAIGIAFYFTGSFFGGQSQFDLNQFKKDGWFGKSPKGIELAHSFENDFYY